MTRQTLDDLLSNDQLLPGLDNFDCKIKDMFPSIVKEAFFASLERNEGRSLRFALVISSDYECQSLKKLRDPLRLNAKNLQVISVAFDPSENCFVIGGVPGDIKVVGVVARPEPLPGLLNPTAIVIEAEDPGVISIEIVGKSKVVYDKGWIKDFSQPPDSWIKCFSKHSGLPGKAKQCHVVNGQDNQLYFGPEKVGPIEKRTYDSDKDAYEKGVDNYWQTYLPDVINTVVKKTRSKQHGGAYLFLDKNSVLGNNSDNNSVGDDNFQGGHWFDGPCERLTNSIVSALIRGSLYGLALQSKFLIKHSHTNGNSIEEAKAVYRPGFLLSRQNVDLACADCAHLTEVDGVTLLSYDFEMLAFGVTINQGNLEDENDLTNHVKTRGNRHKSMAYAVSARKDSIGIVISQDGGVSIFVNDDEGLKCCEWAL